MIARPLTWKPTRDGFALRAYIGDRWYEIWGSDDKPPGPDGNVCRTYGCFDDQRHPSVAAAKAACQKDADGRVLAQLDDEVLQLLDTDYYPKGDGSRAEFERLLDAQRERRQMITPMPDEN